MEPLTEIPLLQVANSDAVEVHSPELDSAHIVVLFDELLELFSEHSLLNPNFFRKRGAPENPILSRLNGKSFAAAVRKTVWSNSLFQHAANIRQFLEASAYFGTDGQICFSNMRN